MGGGGDAVIFLLQLRSGGGRGAASAIAVPRLAFQSFEPREHWGGCARSRHSSSDSVQHD